MGWLFWTGCGALIGFPWDDRCRDVILSYFLSLFIRTTRPSSIYTVFRESAALANVSISASYLICVRKDRRPGGPDSFEFPLGRNTGLPSQNHSTLTTIQNYLKYSSAVRTSIRCWLWACCYGQMVWQKIACNQSSMQGLTFYWQGENWSNCMLFHRPAALIYRKTIQPWHKVSCRMILCTDIERATAIQYRLWWTQRSCQWGGPKVGSLAVPLLKW